MHAGTGGPFFVEPKVAAVKGVENTRWELSYQPPGNEGAAVEIGQYASKCAAIRGLVTHPDRQDRGAIADGDEPAWTPNELTAEPPDAGMVKVRWFDSVDTNQLYWEYAAELRPTDAH